MSAWRRTAGAGMHGAVVMRSGDKVGPRANAIDAHVLSSDFHTDTAVPVRVCTRIEDGSERRAEVEGAQGQRLGSWSTISGG